MHPTDEQRPSLVEEVTAWAREKPSLGPWVVRTRSRVRFVAVAAQVVLVLYFVWEVRISSRKRSLRRGGDEPVGVTQIAYRAMEAALSEDRLKGVSDRERAETARRLSSIEEPTTGSQESDAAAAHDEQLSPHEGQVFLDELKTRTEEQALRLKSDVDAVRLQEKVVFVALIASAIVTFVLVVAGVILILAGRATVGVVAEAIGLIPGVGTVLLTRTGRQLHRTREALRKSEQESIELLRAITLTWSIPNERERARAITKLANDLVQRALRAERVDDRTEHQQPQADGG